MVDELKKRIAAIDKHHDDEIHEQLAALTAERDRLREECGRLKAEAAGRESAEEFIDSIVVVPHEAQVIHSGADDQRRIEKLEAALKQILQDSELMSFSTEWATTIARAALERGENEKTLER